MASKEIRLLTTGDLTVSLSKTDDGRAFFQAVVGHQIAAVYFEDWNKSHDRKKKGLNMLAEFLDTYSDDIKKYASEKSILEIKEALLG